MNRVLKISSPEGDPETTSITIQTSVGPIKIPCVTSLEWKIGADRIAEAMLELCHVAIEAMGVTNVIQLCLDFLDPIEPADNFPELQDALSALYKAKLAAEGDPEPQAP